MYYYSNERYIPEKLLSKYISERQSYFPTTCIIISKSKRTGSVTLVPATDAPVLCPNGPIEEKYQE